MKILFAVIFLVASVFGRRMPGHLSIAGPWSPTGSTLSPWGGSSNYSNTSMANPWGGASVNPLYNSSIQPAVPNPWGSTPRPSNPLDSLWSRIPGVNTAAGSTWGASSGFRTPSGYVDPTQSYLNSLWGRIPGGRVAWRQTSVNGVRCSNGQFLSSAGTSSYGGPTRFTCSVPGRAPISQVCTSLQDCHQLVCRFAQCSNWGGRLQQAAA